VKSQVRRSSRFRPTADSDRQLVDHANKRASNSSADPEVGKGARRLSRYTLRTKSHVVYPTSLCGRFGYLSAHCFDFRQACSQLQSGLAQAREHGRAVNEPDDAIIAAAIVVGSRQSFNPSMTPSHGINLMQMIFNIAETACAT
jgi:hypothetical protein